MPIPVDPAEAHQIEMRLASAKQQNDEKQADLRLARAAATAAQKELYQALQGWYAIHPNDEE